MPITIIPAPFTDINALHNHVPEFDDWQECDWQVRCKNANIRAVISYVDDVPAGYMVSYDRYSDGSIYCWMTAVLPEYRGQGVLFAMMEDLSIWAKAQGYMGISIKTRNNRREMLIFLVKKGFDFIELDTRQPVSDSRMLLYRRFK